MGLGNIGNYVDENWHGGQLEGDFYTHPEMDIEENSRVEKKPNTLVWNWKHVMIRELMRGHHKHDILAKYSVVINRFGIMDKVVDFLDKNDGFLGWFIVDVSNFDDKFGYEDMPEDMRKCNLYAYNATELREIISRSLTSENDGSFDGFLNSDDGISEQISYVDDYTGLPCVEDINGIFDNDDERLSGIADYLLGRKWMTLSERNAFVDSDNRLAFLVSVVRRSFAPKSFSDGKFDDDIDTYDVMQQELEADSQKAVKDAEVCNIHEQALDDVGYTAMPENYDIAEEYRKSDFRKDVQVGKPVPKQEVNNIHERRIDDIGNVSLMKGVSIKNELSKADFRKDVSVDDKFKPFDIKKEMKKSDFRKDVDFDDTKSLGGVVVNRETPLDDIATRDFTDDMKGMNVTKESDMAEIDTEIPDYGDFDDDMHELTDKDYRDDVMFDDVEEFTIDDIRDMKDDEFDYADLSQGDVDVDEMFEEESDRNEAEIDDTPEEVEISSKYDWSW